MAEHEKNGGIRRNTAERAKMWRNVTEIDSVGGEERSGEDRDVSSVPCIKLFEFDVKAE